MRAVTGAPKSETSPKSFRKYKKSPVVEAICEMIFAGSEWDETIVGLFYEKVKDKFPMRRPVEMRKAEISEQKGHSVLVTFASTSSDNPSENAHLLELYGIFQAETPLEESAVQKETRITHENVNTVFEGSITDQLRALFGPEN